jgi:hypothetical protein
VTSIVGTHVEIRPDPERNVVTVILAGDDPVSPKEVIRHLESEGLAARTRSRMIGEIVIDFAVEQGVALKLRFEGVWEWVCELDIQDAIKALFAKKIPLRA